MKKSEAKAARQRWRKAAGAVIAATRKDKDLGQEELARRVGWSRFTLAKVESGNGKIEFGDIMLIANAVGEEPATLIRRILAWPAG